MKRMVSVSLPGKVLLVASIGHAFTGTTFSDTVGRPDIIKNRRDGVFAPARRRHGGKDYEEKSVNKGERQSD